MLHWRQTDCNFGGRAVSGSSAFATTTEDSGLSAALFQQQYFADDHPPIDCLAHVVNREQSDTYGGQRFHFHAGATMALDSGTQFNRCTGQVRRELDRNPGDLERVRKRYQVGRMLGSLNRCNPRDSEDIAFFGTSGKNHLQRFGLHFDASSGGRNAVRFVFCTNVDHVGLTLTVEVCQ